MYTDLVDYLYQEAKEKTLEIEIEARKIYQLKTDKIFNEKKVILDTRYENHDKNKETEFKQQYSKVKSKLKANKLSSKNKVLIKLTNKVQTTLLKKCRSDINFYTRLLKNLILEVN